MNFTLLDLLFKLSLSDKETFSKYFSVIKEHLFDNEDKFLVSSIESYVMRYNTLPFVDFFIEFVDSYNKSKGEIKYKVKTYSESLDYYYDRFVEFSRKKYREILSSSILNSEKSGEDIELIFSKYNKLLRKLEFKSNDVFVKSHIDNFIEEFKSLRDRDSNDLIPTMFRFIDSTTGGINRSDFVLFVSRPQNFKTWIMCHLAVNFSKVILGGKILFFSKEMSKLQIQKRILSIISGLNYENLKRHRVDDNDLLELKNKVLSGLDSEIIIIGKEDDSLYDINYVQSKIMFYNPDVVIIDGLYLFATSDEWVEHSKISRAFRNMSLRFNVPIIGTLQFSRRGYGRGNVAYSDSYEQDASLFIGIERQEDESNSYTNEVIMSILKARDGKVDIKSSFLFDFSSSTMIEKTITDIAEPVFIKKLESISTKLNQKELILLKDHLQQVLKDKFIDDITDEELRKTVLSEFSKNIVLNNNELKGLLSTQESDVYYYFHVYDYVFRVYVSDYIYLNYYRFMPIKKIDLERDDLVVFSSSISASMIQDFTKEIAFFFNRGNKDFIDKISSFQEEINDNKFTDIFSNISFELLEKYLKSVLYFKDPLINILILLNGNLRFINVDKIQNEFLRDLLNNNQYSNILKYYVLNIFYDLDSDDKCFYLKNKYLKIDYEFSVKERIFMETISSFTNEDFRKMVGSITKKANNTFSSDNLSGSDFSDIEIPI